MLGYIQCGQYILCVRNCCQIISNCQFTCLAAGASLNTCDCPSMEKKGICLDNPCKPFGVYRQTKIQVIRWKELPAELRNRIVSRHRSGEGYKKNSAALKVPKSTVAPIILKWKKFGATRTPPRSGHLAQLSSQGRRAVQIVKLNE